MSAGTTLEVVEVELVVEVGVGVGAGVVVVGMTVTGAGAVVTGATGEGIGVVGTTTGAIAKFVSYLYYDLESISLEQFFHRR